MSASTTLAGSMATPDSIPPHININSNVDNDIDKHNPDSDDSDSDTESITDNALWIEGDFILISSDNTRFRIQSFHLYAASRVFQDAKSLAVGELKLHLTDPTTENADTIHHFLRLITSGNGLGYKYPDAWIGLEKAVNLVAFLKKWESKAALNSVAYQAHQILSDHGISRMDFFILGAVLDDPYFCSKVLKSTPQSYQSSLGGPKSWETKALVDGRGDADTADPTALPYDTWLLIPPDYYWALVRAWGESTGNKSNLAIRFLKLIQAVKSQKLHAAP
ncbi:uncharacterized protein EHS24_001972 [Apiotrichum porosum]|uniref:BTB domain-containing protein n=1 Tax=Apiotrichum porosum TaxID=105984 RepID=A0A427XJW2_9TREE|nr:uncharacterized protein EHS24_001972 [Apiotrichum porosum]RSH79044.1 hypothetical protein EHS24_001972 [Apiotrichum porosum]